jgi:hypothetical protein
MIVALGNTTKQDAAFMAQSLLGPPQRQTQRTQLGAADIAQLYPLEIVPDAFDRVQLGGIARLLLQMQPLCRPPRQEFLDGLATVNRRPIPDQQQLASDLAQEHTQET